MGCLFLDGINLMDIIPGTFVVHDDDDEAQLVCNYPTVAGHVQDGVTKLPPSSSVPFSKIAYDQDSPSEAADPIISCYVSILPITEDHQLLIVQAPSKSDLHLLHCSLLI